MELFHRKKEGKKTVRTRRAWDRLAEASGTVLIDEKRRVVHVDETGLWQGGKVDDRFLVLFHLR